MVYEGRDQSNGPPIIKAFLNPLVMWIWVGLVVVVAGTMLALLPSLSPSRATVTVPSGTGKLPASQAPLGVTGGGD